MHIWHLHSLTLRLQMITCILVLWRHPIHLRNLEKSAICQASAYGEGSPMAFTQLLVQRGRRLAMHHA